MLNALAILGLVGFLLGTGRLDKAKAQTIGDMLKHPGTPAKFREKVYDIIEPFPTALTTMPAATAPASQPATGDQIEPATAEERIEFMRRAMETEQLRLENEAQGLRDRQKMLEAKQREVELNLQKLADDKKNFEQQIAASNKKDDGEGFKKSMALFEELKPRQVKDLLAGMTPDAAARFLAAMEPDRAAKIIGEFKSLDEKAFVKTLMDRMGSSPKDNGTTPASATAGASGVALPAAGAVAPGPAAKAEP